MTLATIRRPDAALALILTVALLVVLDFNIVKVALASIAHEMHANATAVRWVTTAYAITSGLLVLGGSGRLESMRVETTLLAHLNPSGGEGGQGFETSSNERGHSLHRPLPADGSRTAMWVATLVGLGGPSSPGSGHDPHGHWTSDSRTQDLIPTRRTP